MAFGDHKGSGLAVICELLGAALVGGLTLAPKWERDGSAMDFDAVDRDQPRCP